MTLAKPIAAAALAIGLIAASASGAFAYSVAWADHNAAVRSGPHNYSPTVNWIYDGQKVTVLSCTQNWCKVKIPGQDGFVKKSALNFGWNGGNGGWNGWGNDGWDNGWNDGHPHGQACVSGPNASFCIGG
jgi:uncharacterized protein YraI